MQAGRELHFSAVSGPVAAARAGHIALFGQLDHAGQQRHLGPVHHHLHACAARHFKRMSGQTKTRHVGDRVHAGQLGQQRAGRVQLGGVGDHFAVARIVEFELLERSRINAHAQRLAQHQHVAGLGFGVAAHAVGVDQTHGDQTVDGLDRIDGVAARNRNAGCAAHVLPAAHDGTDHVERQLVDRHGDQRQRHDRLAAHGIDIRQRIRRGDAAELIRIVHDGHEEIGGGDQRLRVVELVDGGVVRGLDAHHQLGWNHGIRAAGFQNFRQHARRDLAAAAAAMRERCEARQCSGVCGGGAG